MRSPRALEPLAAAAPYSAAFPRTEGSRERGGTRQGMSQEMTPRPATRPLAFAFAILATTLGVFSVGAWLVGA